MKSSIIIDYVDRGTGRGLEPVIKVEIIKSEDPRDTLVSALFESVSKDHLLQLHYTNHKPVATPEGLPSSEKTLLLFNPETKFTGYNIHNNATGFHAFLNHKSIEFKPNGHFTIILKEDVDLFLLGQQYEQYKKENS